MNKHAPASRRRSARRAIAIVLPVSDLGQLRPLLDQAGLELPVIQA
jgi:hypothetical protein